MPTRPPSPDPSGADSLGADASAFGGLGAGLSFFQDWMKAAGSALPNMQAAAQGAAGKAATPWSLPTLDPEELDKRIQDLRTVQFWLEQNARLISMTIQGLEVQRMTLTTLRGMNVSMDAVRDSLKARAASTPFDESPSAPAPESAAPPPSATSAEESPDTAEQPAVNPLRWWDTLTQQFSTLANQAVQAAQATAHSMETPPAAPAASKPAAKPKAAAKKVAKRPARQAGVSARKPPPDSHSAD
jgi:hypothetical protein